LVGKNCKEKEKVFNNKVAQEEIFVEFSAPTELFKLIFPESLMLTLMKWTNVQAAKKIDDRKRTHSNMKEWFRLSIKEMKAFIGVLSVMGIVKTPNIASYWEKDSSLFFFDGVVVKAFFHSKLHGKKYSGLLACGFGNNHFWSLLVKNLFKESNLLGLSLLLPGRSA